MQNKNILSDLKNQIANILKQLHILKNRKQKELREINKLEEKYSCLDKMLETNLPVNDSTIPVFEVVFASGDFVHGKLTELLNRAAEDEKIFLSAASTGSSTMLSIATCQAFDGHITLNIKREAIDIFSSEREKIKQEIVKFLNAVSPHLVNIYLSANDSLDMISADPERGAAGMIRETVDQAVGILAPNDEIKNQPWFIADPDSKSGITRRHRFRYIAENKSIDNDSKETILKNADLFILTLDNLSGSFHKRKELDSETTKSFFYQAETLLKTLSQSIKLN